MGRPGTHQATMANIAFMAFINQRVNAYRELTGLPGIIDGEDFTNFIFWGTSRYVYAEYKEG